MPIEDEELDKDTLPRMLEDYGGTLERLADLPETEYDFLVDVYVHKRAYSTIARKNPGICNAEKIRAKTNEIMEKILTEEDDPWPGSM